MTRTNLLLEGWGVLITGRNGRLGRMIALGFYEAGARLAVTRRNEVKKRYNSS